MGGAAGAIGVLPLWSGLAGLALWCPALGVPIGLVQLQMMDFIGFAGWYVLLIYVRHLPRAGGLCLLLLVSSLLLSFALSGGVFLVLAWTMLFAVPATGAFAIALADPVARHAFLTGFMVAAMLSVALFMLQILFGAETLDFRNNLAFRLPPHFGRGFALFPEVSTFAAHCVMAGGAALAIVVHPRTPRRFRRNTQILLLALLVALLFSRSTSVIVLLPVIVTIVLFLTQRPTLNTLVFVFLLMLLGTVFLITFAQLFYAERLENDAATRSAAMRLASILGGLSPLWQAEYFGLGVGENGKVSYRAYEAARQFGLDFGKLPEGINSHIVTRIFEEGWPAVIGVLLAMRSLWVARGSARLSPDHAAVLVIGVAACLVALMVTGYRGIYSNWLWLGIAAAMVPEPAARRSIAGAMA